MSIQDYVVSNDGGWEEDSDGWFSSPLDNGLAQASWTTVIDIPVDLDILWQAMGYDKSRENALSGYDFLTIKDKDGTSVLDTGSRQDGDLLLLASGSPYSITYKNTSGHTLPNYATTTDNRARIKSKYTYIFDGDFTKVAQSDFDDYIAQKIILSTDSSALLSEGSGLQVTGVAYYPVDHCSELETLAFLDANGNNLFEHEGECYAVKSGDFIYIFDANRAFLFYHPSVLSYIKMQGLVEQINVDEHENTYDDEIFKSQITFNRQSIFFANQNQTREQAYPNPTVSFNLFEKVEFSIPSHDRKTIYDPNGDMYLAGRIKGTVKEQNVPASKKVMCFTQYGTLVASTYSDKLGNFEFTELKHNIKYMITTQAGHEVGMPPDFHPDTVGYITPEVYKL